MKKVLLVSAVISLFLFGCGDKKEEEKQAVTTEETEETASAEEVEVETEEEKPSMKEEAEANAIENPAKPAAMLYDKSETKFQGMNYHFKGELVKVEKLEGLLDGMTDALLVKNEQGYVMPIFPPYEVTANVGDEIEVWGPLSGDGYTSTDLGVDNVVGVTGAMNASLIDINGEQQ